MKPCWQKESKMWIKIYNKGKVHLTFLWKEEYLVNLQHHMATLLTTQNIPYSFYGGRGSPDLPFGADFMNHEFYDHCSKITRCKWSPSVPTWSSTKPNSLSCTWQNCLMLIFLFFSRIKRAIPHYSSNVQHCSMDNLLHTHGNTKDNN